MTPSSAFKPASEGIYDVVVIGGGMAAVLAAYRIKSAAAEAGTPLNVALVADRLNSPAFAGTQVVHGLEGFFEPGQRQPEAIDALLRKGQDWLENTIEEKNIDCRFDKGYELKGVDRQQLVDRRASSVSKNLYRPEEIVENTEKQTLELPGYPASFRMECVGQVNIPELIDGVVADFKKLGGAVIIPAKYETHSYHRGVGAVVQTSEGIIRSRAKPIIATGCEHMLGLPEFPVKHSETVYTMAMTFGPLEDADARKIAAAPVAFCNVPDHQNMLWGSLDSKNMLTLGYGEVSDPAARNALEQELLSEAEKLYPGLAEKYPPQIKFGGIMYTPNLMPVVGETEQSFLVTGWGGRGCVPAAAAASAIEKALKGDRSELKLFEDLQPGAFHAGREHRATPTRGNSPIERDFN